MMKSSTNSGLASLVYFLFLVPAAFGQNLIPCSERSNENNKPLIVEEWAWGADIGSNSDPIPRKERQSIKIADDENPPTFFWFRVSGCENHIRDLEREDKFDISVEWSHARVANAFRLHYKRTPAVVTRFARNGKDKLEGYKVELQDPKLNAFDFRTNTNRGTNVVLPKGRHKFRIFYGDDVVLTRDGEEEILMRVN